MFALKTSIHFAKFNFFMNSDPLYGQFAMKQILQKGQSKIRNQQLFLNTQIPIVNREPSGKLRKKLV